MTRIEASNHIGYEVQWLTTNGWNTWNDIIYNTREDAERSMKELYEGCIELRVYEIVTEQEQS